MTGASAGSGHPAGRSGLYSVVVDSLTNVDTPYVHFAFGAPEMGSTIRLWLPYLEFGTNLGGRDAGARTARPARRAGSTRGHPAGAGLGSSIWAAEGRASLTFPGADLSGSAGALSTGVAVPRASCTRAFTELAEADALGGGRRAGGLNPLVPRDLHESGHSRSVGRPALVHCHTSLPERVQTVDLAAVHAADSGRIGRSGSAMKRSDLAGTGRAGGRGGPAPLQALARRRRPGPTASWARWNRPGCCGRGRRAADLRDHPGGEPRVGLTQGLLEGPAGQRSGRRLARGVFRPDRAWYGATLGQPAPIARFDVRTAETACRSPSRCQTARVRDPDPGPEPAHTPSRPIQSSCPLDRSWAARADFGSDQRRRVRRSISAVLEEEPGRRHAHRPARRSDRMVPAGRGCPTSAFRGPIRCCARGGRGKCGGHALDPGHPRSLRLGGITLGDNLSVEVPAGGGLPGPGSTLSASRGFVLRVSAGSTWRRPRRPGCCRPSTRPRASSWPGGSRGGPFLAGAGERAVRCAYGLRPPDTDRRGADHGPGPGPLRDSPSRRQDTQWNYRLDRTARSPT